MGTWGGKNYWGWLKTGPFLATPPIVPLKIYYVLDPSLRVAEPRPGRGDGETSGRWLKQRRLEPPPISFITKTPKQNSHPRERAYRFFGKSIIFDFTMSRPSIIFSETAHLIYYVLDINHF